MYCLSSVKDEIITPFFGIVKEREEITEKCFVYLLDEKLELDSVGLIFTNKAELMVLGITELSYRECTAKISGMTDQIRAFDS